MPFNFQLSDELKITIRTLAKKNPKMTEAINKKIKQIIQSDEYTITHYKNMRYNLKEYKRVHIMKSFVLLFKLFKEKDFILFDKLGYHDNIYKKKK